jgi:hypothetical protein
LEQGERRCSPARSRGAADGGCREGEDKTTSIFFNFFWLKGIYFDFLV